MNACEDQTEPLGECPAVPARVVYIAGPMSGLPEFNYPAFFAKAAELRAQGFEVRNPAENDGTSTDKPWTFYMKLGLQLLLECDEIHLLPGWSNSRGASLERLVAANLEMKISGATS